MNLHNNKTEFQELITLTANDKNIPESAVERDYFIVRALLFLSKSEYVKSCVFKGGTSLSKCYPGSIERFSEDIDLTYIPEEGMSDKQIERRLKSIEKIMTVDSSTEIIRGERNQRNKSTYFWCDIPDNRIKLEIGSSVRPEPYASRTMKSYIQEYLEENGYESVVEEYELTTVTMNVLNIERTFIDKIMSVKRHSICGSINSKARHIYDVTRLFNLPEIESFLQDKQELKRLIKLTKQTDSIYFEKRNIPESYNPTGPYAFSDWKSDFLRAKEVYEHLHEQLLYTDEQQQFSEAIKVFEQIDVLLKEIGE